MKSSDFAWGGGPDPVRHYVYFVVNKPLVDRFVSQSVCRFTSLFIACDLLDKNFFENDKFLFILIFL